MRTRRRLRRGGKHVGRPGMKGDWIVLMNLPCRTTVPGPFVCNSTTATDVQLFTLLDHNDVQFHGDAMTVMRIVGEIDWLMTAKFSSAAHKVATVAYFTLYEMIYLATSNGAGGSVTELDPRNSADLESDNIMWMRMRRFAYVLDGAANYDVFDTVNFGGLPDGMGDHLDIRVRRRMKQGDALIYSCCVLTDTSLAAPVVDMVIAMDPSFQGNLRAYVKF